MQRLLGAVLGPGRSSGARELLAQATAVATQCLSQWSAAGGMQQAYGCRSLHHDGPPPKAGTNSRLPQPGAAIASPTAVQIQQRHAYCAPPALAQPMPVEADRDGGQQWEEARPSDFSQQAAGQHRASAASSSSAPVSKPKLGIKASIPTVARPAKRGFIRSGPPKSAQAQAAENIKAEAHGLQAHNVEMVTKARAHCIGQALDIKAIRSKFQHAILYEARDFLVLSTQAMSQGGRHTTHDSSNSRAAQRSAAMDDDITKEMPMVECVAVFEFGCVVFFDHFTPVSYSVTDSTADTCIPDTQHVSSDQSSNPVRGNNPGGSHSSSSSSRASAPNLNTTRQDDLEMLGISLLAPYATNKMHEPPAPEEAELLVSPSLKQVLEKGVNMLRVQQWDRGNLETVSRSMAQSIALDYYTDIVDDRLSNMEQLLEEREAWYLFTRWQRLTHGLAHWAQGLVRPAGHDVEGPARNHEAQLIRSMLLTMKVINRVGVMDKDHTPWESDRHDTLYQGLKRYYSIEKRSRQLFDKLEQIKEARDALIQLNSSKRTMQVELLISALITFEIALTLYFHDTLTLPSWLWTWTDLSS